MKFYARGFNCNTKQPPFHTFFETLLLDTKIPSLYQPKLLLHVCHQNESLKRKSKEFEAKRVKFNRTKVKAQIIIKSIAYLCMMRASGIKYSKIEQLIVAEQKSNHSTSTSDVRVPSKYCK